MKLCYVSTMLAPFDEGGPGTVARYMLKEFVKMPNLEISLIISDSAKEKDILSEFGDRFNDIMRIPQDKNNFDYFKFMTKGAKQTWKIINDNDVVHINNIWTLRGLFVSPFTFVQNKPLFFTWHGLTAKHYFGEKNESIKKLVHSAEFSLGNTFYSKVIVNSTFMREYVSRYLDIERICLIRNGIALDEIKKANKIHLDGEISLVFVGRLIPIKGVDLLLKAFAVVRKSTTKDVKLYLAGSGSHESSYRLLASKLNIDKEVNFLGHLPISECYSLCKSCTIFVSSSRFESAPMAVLEAMAAGAAIVATDTGGTPEIAVNMRNCLLTNKNPEDIAEKILYLINHPEECARLSNNNTIDAEKYSWRNIALDYIKLYSSHLE